MALELTTKDILASKVRDAIIDSELARSHLHLLPSAQIEEIHQAAADRANWRLAGLEGWPDELRQAAKAAEDALQRQFQIELPPLGASATQTF